MGVNATPQANQPRERLKIHWMIFHLILMIGTLRMDGKKQLLVKKLGEDIANGVALMDNGEGGTGKVVKVEEKGDHIGMIIKTPINISPQTGNKFDEREKA